MPESQVKHTATSFIWNLQLVTCNNCFFVVPKGAHSNRLVASNPDNPNSPKHPSSGTCNYWDFIHVATQRFTFSSGVVKFVFTVATSFNTFYLGPKKSSNHIDFPWCNF